MAADQELIEAARNGDVANMQDILACGVDPRHEDSLALRVAAEHGHAECVRMLLAASGRLVRLMDCSSG